MRYLATQYNLKNRALEIYLSGCKGENGVHCKGCHNPITWDFDFGHYIMHNLVPYEIRNKIQENSELINNIWILGGEPLDQDLLSLAVFLCDMKQLFPDKKIWLFTRRDILEVPTEIKESCDYIKTGKYDMAQKVEGYEMYGVTLATSNQQVHKLR